MCFVAKLSRSSSVEDSFSVLQNQVAALVASYEDAFNAHLVIYVTRLEGTNGFQRCSSLVASYEDSFRAHLVTNVTRLEGINQFR
jgi:hypothetical protein